jgi:hypothetical protein
MIIDYILQFSEVNVFVFKNEQCFFHKNYKCISIAWYFEILHFLQKLSNDLTMSLRLQPFSEWTLGGDAQQRYFVRLFCGSTRGFI